MKPARGWGARIALQFASRGERTVLAQKQQQGPLTVQRAFYPEGAACHLYLLHPPGGVVGGDRLEIEAQVATGAHALLTTPGAAKFYRSAGAMAQQRQHFEVADGGVLEWLPQESILFPGARLQLQTQVTLRGSARLIGWEILSLGRPVIDERFDRGCATIGLRIERDDKPMLSERLRLDVEQSPQTGLDGASGLRGLPITATLIATGAVAADLEAARAAVPAEPGFALGLTLLDDLLVARALASKVEPVMHQFRAIWRCLRPRLLGQEASSPRIWAT
ncbi:urease accessory protein [Lamprobacter modestohalophilus]|uniref:Urease accessory protein UreD n=1 Tax=Lamprobacter modestohalophilus TaxID=1064514 RepID=A0A9X0W9Y1_9GAMM|nr:urease accessory protein UreD [Lamprobacter modestohalophilus]MBK1619718.1 urease accessory protein [Lamprobacter modestohalophilus]MCF7980139.1 urease accessory protein UreD [Chromatiaceae bacterium]MCF7995666.1 urease accessory protein UreD [Chromatiaceae bacterium]MCF8014979.1 urease accessory protein UreD [Chromatiaceae bacterium]